MLASPPVVQESLCLLAPSAIAFRGELGWRPHGNTVPQRNHISALTNYIMALPRHETTYSFYHETVFPWGGKPNSFGTIRFSHGTVFLRLCSPQTFPITSPESGLSQNMGSHLGPQSQPRGLLIGCLQCSLRLRPSVWWPRA
jgi:hypothetical protein